MNSIRARSIQRSRATPPARPATRATGPTAAILAALLAPASATLASSTLASTTLAPSSAAAAIAAPALTLTAATTAAAYQPTTGTPDPSDPNPSAAPAPATPLTTTTAPSRFGDAGQRWWSVSSGLAFGDEFDGVAQLAFHQFLADSLELALVLGGWYHDQDDPAASLSLSAHFRYHFLNRDAWTVYAMAGAGLMGSTDDVPEGGTSFNFLPTAGLGTTWRLGDGPARLDLGVRWHHISNANFSSSGDNPDRDAAMLTIGIMFPF